MDLKTLPALTVLSDNVTIVEVEQVAWTRDAIDRPKSFKGHVREIKIHEAEIAKQVASAAEQ